LPEIGGGEECAVAEGDCGGFAELRRKELRLKIYTEGHRDTEDAEKRRKKAREENGAEWLRENQNII
jgi:hypothetical protein